MDNQKQSSADMATTPSNNQFASQVVNLPPEIWLMVSEHLDSVGDKFRLSRVNKFFFSLFLSTRAKCEAEERDDHPISKLPSMLYLALKRNWPFGEIEKIITAYASSNSYLLRTHVGFSWEPPLHVAARLGRIDVVDLLLKNGIGINLRWGGQWGGCSWWAHTKCNEEGRWSCKNALSIAREMRNAEMENDLLQRGIEDIGYDKMVAESRDWWQPETYSVCMEW
ncbi:hypothetical protein F4824DRAFT_505195 [Ustulina deusta]|nr:hypothetical protein F4823DRAFT_567153 [Ustulina deusta]KAI3330345.1 hypothetical protein F4824DRAFT_505195 [Ustulina deusta]